MSWHGGSRFWMFVPFVLIAATFITFWFDDPAVFTQVTMIVMGGAGAQTTVRHFRESPSDHDAG
jgi:hypothetical protein